jgi:hypothetical protein
MVIINSTNGRTNDNFYQDTLPTTRGIFDIHDVLEMSEFVLLVRGS